jgi:hypothetical protein
MIGLAAPAAYASATILTFEGLQDGEQILGFYNGGLGSDGSGPGGNVGVTFSANAFAATDSNSGGSGNFAGEPTPKTVVFFVSGGPDVMNVDGGFTTAFSFFYSGIDQGGSIDIWSGLDATGTLLATLAVPQTSSGHGSSACGTVDFCPFFQLGTTFPGTAHSVDFGGAADQFFFDNLTLGTPGSSAPVSEPVTLALFGTWLAGTAWARRRGRVPMPPIYRRF